MDFIAVGVGHEIAQALWMALVMFWDILWALILGFWLSGIVQAVVTKSEMSRLLPDASARSLAIATGLGAASSSCSYAAVALARSIFRKGADFTAAMAFELASTNLVVELGIILAVLMGWQFTVAEFAGGALMVALLGVLFRRFLSRKLVESAREHADRGLKGRMEDHADMDMAVTEGPLLRRIFSAKGWTAISHYFVMDWASVWVDVAVGLLLAGALAAWVPPHAWQSFFLSSHPRLAIFWGPIIGPVVAILSFVCSVGNVPLAAVLWNGGISFGGVISFLFADLLVLPILNIYRKYYGWKMAGFILVTFYVSMVLAALAIDLLFRATGMVPSHQADMIMDSTIRLNYTTILNMIFLALAAVLTIRFLRTGGPAMLKMMNAPETGGHAKAHAKCH